MSNTEVSDLTSEELTGLAKVVDLWEEIISVLGKLELKPRDYALRVETDGEERYLGWVGCGEHGSYSFQPAIEAADV